MMRLLCLLLLLLPIISGGANAQPGGQRFVSIAFHDVADRVDQLEVDAVSTTVLAQFFDWLKGSGWTAVSLDDLDAAARGTRPLPDKAILLTVDDGYRSLYTHIFPLLKVYRYPMVAALTGSWMEARPDGMVQYGDRIVPRGDFVSWAEAREMQASGLVEFASHTYGLHRGVLANPQGNMIPAAMTWRYDAETGRYETDAQYRTRIRADLQHARQQMAANLGRSPRALVWPFGRYTGPALVEAKAAGFTFALTLEPEPAYTSDLFAIHRYFPSRNPSVADLARNLRFDPDYPATRRIACLTLDALAAAGSGPAEDAVLGRMIEGLRALGANMAIIDAQAGPLSPGAPLGEVYFPTKLQPMRADLLSRATWQIRTRGGADVFLRLPVDAAVAAVGEARMPDLFADMMRYTAPDGLALSAPANSGELVADLPGAIRARRAALDPARLDRQSRLAVLAYRGAATIDPRQRLLLERATTAGVPAWADMALLPPTDDVAATATLARQLRADGWLRPDVAGRIALGLPIDPGRQVEALRIAQRQGATAFALCPQPPPLPPSKALSSAFSAATYPYRP